MIPCTITQPAYTLVRTDAPGAAPVSSDDLKARLRIGSNAESGTMADYIKAAVDKLEGPKGILSPARCLMRQTWVMTLDGFPSGDLIIPLVPVQSITAFGYIDGNSADQVIAADAYQLIADQASTRLVLPSGGSWPTPIANAGSVSIQFVAGYDELPPMLREDVLTFASYWFDNRNMVGQIPPGWSSTYRKPVLA